MMEHNVQPIDSNAAPTEKRGGLGCFGKAVIAAVVLLLVAVVLWYAWLANATKRRDAAWERLRAAGIATSVEELKAQVQPVPAEVNPAVEYERAWSLIDPEDEAWHAWNNFEPAAEERTPEEQAAFAKLERAMVEAHEEALELVAEADGKIRPAVDVVRADFGVWSERDGPLPADLISLMVPSMNNRRSLARLLAADSNIAGADGDGKRMVQNVIRIIGLADAIDSDSHTVVEHLVATGIRELATNAVIDNSTTAVDAPYELKMALTALLLDDAPATAGYRAGMEGEATTQQALLQELDAGRLTMNSVAGSGQGNGSPLHKMLRPIMRGEAAEMAEYMLITIKAAETKRFPMATTQLPNMDLDERSKWRDLFLLILLPSLDRALEAEFRGRTDRRLAAATLAIRSYQRDHDGRLPSDLEALVPDYLPAVPIDPMAAAGDLRYDSERGLLWSVGADGIDAGGDETVEKGSPHRWTMKDAVVRLKP